MLKVVLLFVGLVIAIGVATPDLLSSLSQGKAPSAVAATEKPAIAAAGHGGIVRLTADRSGHYVTKIEANNRSLAAMVDTGATVIALRYEDARALGLVFPGDKFDIVIRTANGEGRARRVQLRSVRLASIVLRDVDAIVLEQGALTTNLLGMSFLKRLARFEFQRGQLVMEQ